MIPKENYEALKKINEISERQLKEALKKIDELKGQIEILKKFSILGELINEKNFVCNLR